MGIKEAYKRLGRMVESREDELKDKNLTEEEKQIIYDERFMILKTMTIIEEECPEVKEDKNGQSRA